jgi:hypothetical protein
MSPDQQINHLEVLGAALTTVATECSVLSLGPDTTEAIATLTKAAAGRRVALVERILAWLDGNCDAPEARSALTAARANAFESETRIILLARLEAKSSQLRREVVATKLFARRRG